MSSLVPIFSIESGHVISALAKISSGSLPEIIFIHQEDFPFQENVDSERLEESALKALSKSLKPFQDFVLEKKHAHLGEPAIILGAPWYQSESKIIKGTEKAAFVVKESYIDELIKRELEERQKDSKLNTSGLSLVDKKIGSILLNGYATAQPYGKKAVSVEFPLFLSMMPASFKEKIKEILKTALPFKQSIWETLSMILFTGLQNIAPESKNSLIIEVGAELTEISHVKNSSLEETVSLPFGTNTLIRSISKDLKVTPQIAHSMLELFQNKKVEASSSDKMTIALQEAEMEWRKLFTEALTSLSRTALLPTTAYLFSQTEYLPICAKFIEGEEFVQSMLPGGKFTIIPADALDLHKIVATPFLGRRTPSFQISTLFVSWLLSQKQK